MNESEKFNWKLFNKLKTKRLKEISIWVWNHKRRDITDALLAFQGRQEERKWDKRDNKHGKDIQRCFLIGYLEVFLVNLRQTGDKSHPIGQLEYGFGKVGHKDQDWFYLSFGFDYSLENAERYKQYRDEPDDEPYYYNLHNDGDRWYVYALYNLYEKFYSKKSTPKPKLNEYIYLFIQYSAKKALYQRESAFLNVVESSVGIECVSEEDWQKKDLDFPFEAEFPVVDVMGIIKCLGKNLSHHASLINYISWQYYLHFNRLVPPPGKDVKDTYYSVDRDMINKVDPIFTDCIPMAEEKKSIYETFLEADPDYFPSWYTEPERSLKVSIKSTMDRLEKLIEDPNVFDTITDIPKVTVGKQNDILVWLPINQLLKYAPVIFHIQDKNGNEIKGSIEKLKSDDERFKKLCYKFADDFFLKSNAVAAIDSKPCEDGTYVIILKGVSIKTKRLSWKKRFQNAEPFTEDLKAAASKEDDELVFVVEDNDHIERGKIKIDEDTGNLSGYFKMKPPYQKITLLLPSKQIVNVKDRNEELIEFKDSILKEPIDLRKIRYELD
jgi:hypothetical protein